MVFGTLRIISVDNVRRVRTINVGTRYMCEVTAVGFARRQRDVHLVDATANGARRQQTTREAGADGEDNRDLTVADFVDAKRRDAAVEGAGDLAILLAR
jgi:hypothetical protein